MAGLLVQQELLDDLLGPIGENRLVDAFEDFAELRRVFEESQLFAIQAIEAVEEVDEFTLVVLRVLRSRLDSATKARVVGDEL